MQRSLKRFFCEAFLIGRKGMEIKIENNLSANEYNNVRSTVGWDTKDIDVVKNAIKNSIIIKKAT